MHTHYQSYPLIIRTINQHLGDLQMSLQEKKSFKYQF